MIPLKTCCDDIKNENKNTEEKNLFFCSKQIECKITCDNCLEKSKEKLEKNVRM